MLHAEPPRCHSTVTALTALQKRVFLHAGGERSAVRRHACSVQQHVSALVFGKHDCSLATATLPHLLRDRFLRPTASLLYGADRRLCGYEELPLPTESGCAKIVGAAVLRTQVGACGVAVAMREDPDGAPELLLFAPGAPMALLERDFYEAGLASFEADWASEEAATTQASHDACAQFVLDVGADRFPAGVLARSHCLRLHGAVPFLRLQTPSTAKEMAAAAAAVRVALAERLGELASGAGCLTRAVANARDSASEETRAIRLTTLLFQHDVAVDGADLARAAEAAVGSDALEDALHRAVVTDVGALLALRVDPADDLADANFEVRADAVARLLPELTEEQAADFDDVLASTKADETRARRMLAAGGSGDRTVLYPPVNLAALFEKPTLCCTHQLVDGGSLDQLPGALLPFFERGYHASELLRVKYVSDVAEYAKTLGSLLCRRSAIALVDASLPRERSAFFTFCCARGAVEMRSRDLPRLLAAPWCLVLVRGADGEVSVVRTATARGDEPLVFASSARDQIAKNRPDVESTAQALLCQLRSTEERLDALLASRSLSAAATQAGRADGKSVKRLRVAVGLMAKAMTA